MKINKIKLIENPKVILLDNNPISIAKYKEEYPEQWKEICKGLKEKANDK